MEKYNNKRILAAIPCYNEEATIGSVILKAKPFVNEVLVVDDGSTDETIKVAEFAGANIIKHSRNLGYGAAVKNCFDYARKNNYDIMIILDGDGQHDASQIEKVIEPIIKKEADISIGSRFINNINNEVPLYRKIGILFLTKLTNIGSKNEQKVSDGQSGFRAYSKKAIQLLDLKDNDMGISSEILLQGRKKNLQNKEIPITCRYDVETSTKKPFKHGIGVFISILKYMEVQHSLLFFGIPGLILFLIGMSLGFYTYLSYESTKILALGQALITLMFLIIGTLCAMTGLILHAVINAQYQMK